MYLCRSDIVYYAASNICDNDKSFKYFKFYLTPEIAWIDSEIFSHVENRGDDKIGVSVNCCFLRLCNVLQ